MFEGEDVTKPVWPSIRYHLTRLSGGAFYGITLLGRPPVSPSLKIADIWPGQPDIAIPITSNSFAVDGEIINQTRNLWVAAGASDNWLAFTNSFSWLRDLKASGDQVAKDTARRLVADWVQCNQELGSIALNQVGWRADIIGKRLYFWLTHWHDFFEDAELNFRHDILKSMGRQLRHLRRVAAYQPILDGNITALKGWLAGCLMLKSETRHLTEATQALSFVLAEQILADGGHISRNPAKQISVLKDLIDIRMLFRESKNETPTALQNAIDKMAPMVRFLRHGDKGLALFNGSFAGSVEEIDMTLSYADARGRAPIAAPHSGYEKLKAGKLCVFMDVGNPAPIAQDKDLFAGPLSVEISVGKDRMIVNCGGARRNKNWQGHERATAAHSTLCVDDTNASSLSKKDNRQAIVTSEHLEEEGNHWINASHNGYEATFGLTHSRRLFMTETGEDLRGEDILAGPAEQPFDIRFHLHPKLRVSILHNQSSALLKLPNGEGWRLRISGADMKLMDSIYYGDGGELKRSQQIILSGRTVENTTSVKWALRKEKK